MMRSSSRSLHPNPVPLLCLLALFLVGQTQIVAHHAIVRHRLCPLDGALAHDNHGHGEGAIRESVEDGRAGLRVESLELEVGHDDHCPLELISRERKDRPPTDVRIRRPFKAVTVVRHSRPEPRERWTRVFEYAPKQSPPALTEC